MPSPWKPEQYHRFYAQRRQPFLDTMQLIEPAPNMRILDLGCGTGALTRELHNHLQAAFTLGIDSSETMLAESVTGEGLHFKQVGIEDFEPPHQFDVVFSNAALQWLPDHPKLWKRVFRWVKPGGQLAIQIPANHDHPTHVTAAEVALEEPYRTALNGWTRQFPVLPVEEYARLLDTFGADPINARLQVYVHHMPSRDALVEWVKGSLLTAYQRRMPEALFPDYLERYTTCLFAKIPEQTPITYPFKRIVMWARRAG